MNAEHTNEHDEHGEDHAGMTVKRIWQVFFILLGITVIEFIIALYFIPHLGLNRGIGNFAYIVLTLLKAFYIVAYFMHLKFEKMALKSSIIVVFVFIIYFIILMLTEGSFLNTHMFH